jgi:hypothetical protein
VVSTCGRRNPSATPHATEHHRSPQGRFPTHCCGRESGGQLLKCKYALRYTARRECPWRSDLQLRGCCIRTPHSGATLGWYTAGSLNPSRGRGGTLLSRQLTNRQIVSNDSIGGKRNGGIGVLARRHGTVPDAGIRAHARVQPARLHEPCAVATHALLR